jgi:hypothetical protein
LVYPTRRCLWVTPPEGPLLKRVEVLGEYLIEKPSPRWSRGQSRARRMP